MEESFHHLLLITQSLFQKKVVAKAGEQGLLPGQAKFLEYLETHDGCEQKILGEVFYLEAATVTGVLQRMEQCGLVERRSRDGNRKSNYVFLTSKGRAACIQVKELFSDYEQLAFEGITPEQKEQFQEILQKILKNLVKEGTV